MVISRTRYIACVAILSAIAFIAMLLDFPIPQIIPTFVKMDFSEVPALIASFALGPIAGVLVCLIKNLLHLFMTTTSGVGELCNFLLGAVLSLTAGFIYKYKKSRSGALIAAVAGSVIMAIISFPINAFISYPFYYNFLPKEVILGMYQTLLPSVDSIEKSLLIFNTPFNVLKGILTSAITFLIYKPLSPIIKGFNKKSKNQIIEESNQ